MQLFRVKSIRCVTGTSLLKSSSHIPTSRNRHIKYQPHTGIFGDSEVNRKRHKKERMCHNIMKKQKKGCKRLHKQTVLGAASKRRDENDGVVSAKDGDAFSTTGRYENHKSQQDRINFLNC